MIRQDQPSIVTSREPNRSRGAGRLAFEEQSSSIAIATFPGKGRGVVAQRQFRAGETIERPPVIVIPREQVALIRETKLASYYYEWGDDDDQGAIALGYGSLYNHSYEPNARFEFHEDQDCLEFIALRDIERGEEITINYNNLEESASDPVNFDVH
jgi:SET domain-containing protein